MKSDFLDGLTILKKKRVWAVRALAGVTPRFHSTSGMLKTTAYLLLGYMAPN
jgi:hypothetical protein